MSRPSRVLRVGRGERAGAVAAAAMALFCSAAVGAPPGKPAAAPQVGTRAQPAQAQRGPVFDESTSLERDLDAALARARELRQRVLVVLGTEGEKKSTDALHRVLVSPGMARMLRLEFLPLLVETGAGPNAAKNREKASALGVTFEEDAEHPVMAILDADGKLVAQMDLAEVEGRLQGRLIYNQQRVDEFLYANRAIQPTAETLLGEARSRAASGSKRVLVAALEPEEEWCERLSAFLHSAKAKPVLEKHFVVLELDSERNVGTTDLVETHAGRDLDGLPWFGFLDQEGKLLSSSREKGKANIGYPNGEEELAAFRGMLKAAGASVTDAEVKTLEEALKEAAAAKRPGR